MEEQDIWESDISDEERASASFSKSEVHVASWEIAKSLIGQKKVSQRKTGGYKWDGYPNDFREGSGNEGRMGDLLLFPYCLCFLMMMHCFCVFKEFSLQRSGTRNLKHGNDKCKDEQCTCRVYITYLVQFKNWGKGVRKNQTMLLLF